MMLGWLPENMDDLAMWSVLVGFFLPAVINFIVNAAWSARVKSLVAFGVSGVAGSGVALFSGAYEGLGVVSAVLLTFVVAVSAYSQFWKQVAPFMQRGMAEKLAELPE